VVVLKKADVYSTLETYINKEHIPEKFGGGFTFNNGMLPDLDNGIRQGLHWLTPTESLPPGPIKFTEDGDGKRMIVGTGTVDGKTPRNVKIATLEQETVQ
jgi:hypothetical protein